MFDRLDDLLIRYEEVMGELQEPDVANDPERFRSNGISPQGFVETVL